MSASASPRFTINRRLALILPKEPFLEWLQQAMPTDPPLTMAQVRDDLDAFLIPDSSIASDADAIRWIEQRWRMFFEEALFGWCMDTDMWPEKLSLSLFRTWFDVEMHSMVWDLSDEPLSREDWDDDDDEVEATVH